MLKIKITQIGKLYELECNFGEGTAYVCKINTKGYEGTISNFLMISIDPLYNSVSFIGIPINRALGLKGLKCFIDGWTYTDNEEHIEKMQTILNPYLNVYCEAESEDDWLNLCESRT